MSDKSDAIARLDSARIHFRAHIATLPSDAYQEMWLGTWNLSQVLAHMAGWFREMAGAMERVGRGEKPAPDGVDYSDPEPWNARFALQAKPAPSALADWDAAYTAYRDAAVKLPDHLFGIDPERNRPRIGNRLLQGAGVDHFAEHEPELSAWLAARE